MRIMYDVLVIGGGIVGASTAYHLARAGANAMLVDRGDDGRATSAAAGILAAKVMGVGHDMQWLTFGAEADDYYPQLIEQLRADGEAQTGYAVVGMLTVATDESQVGMYEHTVAAIRAQHQRTGIPAEADWHELSAGEAHERFPLLAPVQRAFVYTKAARIDGGLIATAMCNAGVKHGLEIKQASAESLIIDDDVVRGAVVDGDAVEARRVVIAGGAWSPHFAAQLGIQIPIEPMRGQIIHLDVPDYDTAGWPMVEAMNDDYLVPWDDNRIAVGATRELGVGFAPHSTAAGVHRVLSGGLRAAPGLADASVREIRVGLRPVTTDGSPVVSTVPGIDNLFVAAGHGTYGLMLGPYSGKIAAMWA
ncbi:MAG: FAD-binding oxidoreductase, partial [Chloroflexi bacterium]